ncbi:S-adenosyl-L-methionine-dependent methyltransferase [Dendrothele bispora CBS 962.96]|uniref:S-adenosyl-L-methionine-dependent methyltransferase n=1 Tax=Dendrothele bispora (strain CBS 962.96) TaxID=1314807 RepID=A0A4S8LJZ4_DENBC|nr:S-adenosyl-L-methionine-dependent methyltransferase [Dendrothele bispora CBS 962.96]
MSGVNVHSIAAQGFGQGTNELYDRARPSYQSVAISHIKAAVRSDSKLNVLEIGAGTGIFTRALLVHPEWKDAIAQLKAVEPSSGMREVFAKTVTDKRATVQEGTFDNTGVEDGWADVIIIAQAFHWAPDHERACTEFSRVLKPNGVWTMIWNLEDRDAARWVAGLRNRIEQHESGSPQFRLGLWRKAFETIAYNKFFEPQEERVFQYTLETTEDQVLDRACSKSYIAVLPPDEKEKVVSDVRAVLQKGEDKEWIDESKGVFKYPYQTFVVVCRKK